MVALRFPQTRYRFPLAYAAIFCAGSATSLLIWPEHWRSTLVMLGLGLMLAWLIAERTRRRLRQRIHRLRETADAIISGDLSTRIDHPPHDDFFKLSDSIEHMLVRMQDALAEQERLRKQLTRSEKLALIGELAATVAHEINNPLDGLQNAIRIIRRHPDQPNDTRELLDMMDGGLYRIEMIVRRLLTLSRDEPIKPAAVHLAEMVNEATVFVQPRLNRHAIQLVRDFPESLLAAWADRVQFNHVLINLMINGADAMPEGGTLTLRGRPGEDDRTVVLDVSDTGVGIADEHLPHIFEPFYSTRTHQGGTGLGLAVVDRIVEAHQGTIEVESTPAGGTRFSITLPTAHADTSPTAPAGTSTPALTES